MGNLCLGSIARFPRKRSLGTDNKARTSSKNENPFKIKHCILYAYYSVFFGAASF
jgi:hypothetical protein